jgi:hypothetical protein
MLKRGVRPALLCFSMVGLSLGICGAAVVGTSAGTSTVLEPAEVTREFSQRSWQKKDGLSGNEVQALW